MAKNYSFAEMVETVSKGNDHEALLDIGRRYPLAAISVAKIVALAGDDFVDLADCFPENFTAQKVNGMMKKALIDGGHDAEESDIEDVEEAKATTKVQKEYTEMTATELIKLIKERGLSKEIKSTKKSDMIETLEANDGGATEAAEDNDVNPYEGKNAMELFKEAKARGLKLAPKKPAAFYIDALLEDDAAKAIESDEDEWEDEVVEEKPAKPAAKPAAAKAKPAAKAAAAADDDEWDI